MSIIGKTKTVKRGQFKKEGLWRKLKGFQALHNEVWVHHERNDYEVRKWVISC